LRKDLLSIGLMIIFLLPYGYYFAGVQVYDIVAATDTECNGNFEQNSPVEFAPLRERVPLNQSTYQENITSNIMENISQYWWPGFHSTSIEVEGEDLLLSAWYLKQDESMPWVIFVHGIRGCKAGGSILLPSGMLAKAGFNIVVFDLRDHGQSSIEDNRVSAGQKEWMDVRAVYDWLLSEHGAEEGKIGLFGTSMGAGTAAITFSQDKRFNSVWLDSGFSDMQKIIEEELEYQGLPTFLGGAGVFAGKIKTGEDLVKLSPLSAATEIGNRHMYVVHGNQDPRVKVHHGISMCEEAQTHGLDGHVECWFSDSQIVFDVIGENQTDEHATMMLTHTDLYEERLIDFFSETLV